MELVLVDLQDIREAVQSDLSVGTESSLFAPATIDLAINRAYTKIGGMFKWEETKDAQKTSAKASHEYYEYPENFRPLSIWKLTVDGQDYGDPLIYKDYLYEKENNWPSGKSKAWSNFGRRYFIYPTPTAEGSFNIAIHGYKFVDKLVENSDITIFSYSNPEINEAIAMEAHEILMHKGEPEKDRSGNVIGNDLLSSKAKGIVVTVWTKLSQEQSKLVRTTQQFTHVDMFGSRLRLGTDMRGRF